MTQSMVLTRTQLKLEWSEALVVVPGDAPARDVMSSLLGPQHAAWVVISRLGGLYVYAFRVAELRGRLGHDVQRVPTAPIERVLDLQEVHQSTQIPDRDSAAEIDHAWRLEAKGPSIDRWIVVDSAGTPTAVGTLPSDKPPSSEFREWTFEEVPAQAAPPPPPPPASMPPPTPAPAPTTAPRRTRGRGQRATPPRPMALDEATVVSTDADEGTRPVRFPSIDADRALAPGKEVTIIVDLSRSRTAHTLSDALAIGEQPTGWQKLDLTVAVSCAEIDFGTEDRGVVTIVRNDASKPAMLKGTVNKDVQPGTEVVVTAAFFERARFCGSALRRFVVGLITVPDTQIDSAEPPTVSIDLGAENPDVTVFIERLSKKEPGLLRWRVEPRERFDGLPPCLREDIDLGDEPGVIAKGLFDKFPALIPGQHRQSIEGFGDELWRMAPDMFHEAYWALAARYRRRLTIQFISDEPHLPWELMRPSSDDDSVVHQPLALQHIVARWIDRYRGDMRNSVPAGSLVSVAPKYASARLALPRAQEEQKQVVQKLGATALAGTRDDLLRLLENGKPLPPVAVLHFAGHGAFSSDVAAASSIKLENGMTLTAVEVKRKEVLLGRACRTLVFFNACEVGATGSVFGEVGGWADAFLERRFGGFIAPLWAVEEDDSAQVAAELLDSIYAHHVPIGEALRAIRNKYADKSPTFYSYLYYGDVTARIAK